MNAMNPVHEDRAASRPEQRWQQLDLNLLRVFAAIWEHRHLGQAAATLHLTPSAVSHALGRLRVALDDVLFVRDGRRLRPTARAERLAPALQMQLLALRDLLLPEVRFDPRRSQRSFVVGIREALEPLVIPELFARMQAAAPRVALHSVRLSRVGLGEALREGRLDLAIDVERDAEADIAQQVMRHEPLCVVMRQDHPLSRGMARNDYLEAEHALVSGRPAGPAVEDLALVAGGHPPRRIALRCQNYEAGVRTVAASDLLLTLPQRFAQRWAEPLSLHVRSVPLAVPALTLVMHWHAARTTDPAQVWLRAQLSAGDSR